MLTVKITDHEQTEVTDCLSSGPTRAQRQSLYKFGVARATVAILTFDQAQDMLTTLIAADERKKRVKALEAATAEGWEVFSG